MPRPTVQVLPDYNSRNGMVFADANRKLPEGATTDHHYLLPLFRRQRDGAEEDTNPWQFKHLTKTQQPSSTNFTIGRPQQKISLMTTAVAGKSRHPSSSSAQIFLWLLNGTIREQRGELPLWCEVKIIEELHYGRHGDRGWIHENQRGLGH